jgi:hypothetical protein
LKNNLDVAQADVDPLKHYLCHGGFEGRDPGPNFNTDYYQNNNPNVKNSGINPLVHFLKYGKEQGSVAK